MTKLVKSYIDKLKFNEKSQSIHWDSQLPGFGLLVGKKTKSYIAQHDLNGRTIRKKVGVFPNMHPDMARKEALRVINQISSGIDPRAAEKERKAKRKQLVDVAEAYFYQKSGRLAPSTIRCYRISLNNHFSDWCQKDMNAITREMVVSRFFLIGNNTGKTAANSAMKFLGALFRFAAIDDEKLINPVSILSKKNLWNKTHRRTDVISENQMSAWYDAVLKLPNPTFRDAILTAHWTGLRKNEVLKLQWSHVNFEARTITIVETKNGTELNLPMTKQLRGLLLARQAFTESGKWVFSGAGTEGHITAPDSSLKLVKQLSGVGITMHTLRRTFITTAEKLNISPYTIKALVNHKSGGDVTGGYVILTPDRLRTSAQQIVDELCRLVKSDSQQDT